MARSGPSDSTRDGGESDSDQDSVGEEDAMLPFDGIEIVGGSDSRSDTSSRDSTLSELEDDGDRIFLMYTCMLYFHGMFCESPAAAAEAVFKSAWSLILCIYKTAFVLTGRAALKRSKTMREKVLFVLPLQ